MSIDVMAPDPLKKKPLVGVPGTPGTAGAAPSPSLYGSAPPNQPVEPKLIVAAPGVQGGMAKVNADANALPLPGYAAGQAVRSGIGAGLNLEKQFLARTIAPLALPVLAGANALRGAVGASPLGSLPAPPPPAPRVRSNIQPAIIDPSNAASMRVTPPSVNPPSPPRNPTPASNDGSAAGGVPSSVGLVNLGPSANYGGGGTVRDSLASSVTNGVPTYDNASIARLDARNAATNPDATSLGAAPVQPVATAAPNLNVPGLDLPNINTFRTDDAERERAGLAKSLDDQLGDLSFRGLNGRGQRELYANLLHERSGLAQQAGSLAGAAAQSQLAAAQQAGTATQGQVADNQRALLGDALTRDSVATKERGDTARTIALLERPTEATDAQGNLLQIRGTNAAPVVMANGTQVHLPLPPDNSHASPDALLAMYTQQLKNITEAASLSGKDPDYSGLYASPLGKRVQEVIGNSAASRKPTEADVAKLKANPHFAAYFDQHFGAGSSSRYLGGAP